MTHIISCYCPVQAHAALTQQIWPTLKAHLIAGHKMTLELKPAKRSTSANAMLHSLLSTIATSKPWAGSYRDAETWKRLLTAAWLRAKGEQIELLPAIDGHGVDVVFRRTSSLTSGECAELIEYVLAWCAGNEIAVN